MAIPLTCACGRKLQIGEEHAGQQGACPACGRTLRIPTVNDRGGGLFGEPAPIPEEWADHDGRPLPAEADFFFPPPECIGPILSAHTTMSARDRGFPPALRIFLAVAGGLAGIIVGGLIALSFGVQGGRAFLWPAGLMALGIGLAAYFSGFSRACSYVGREGVARFTCSGGRELVGRAEVFCFDEAAELRTTLTSAAYTFEWSDGAGRIRYRIRGKVASASGDPPPDDPYHYALAAERAWTRYLLERVPGQLERDGAVTFPLRAGRSVRLGWGTVTAHLGGPPVELAAREIERAEVVHGAVRILRAGAPEGAIEFPLPELANARLFFHLLGELVGVEVG
jgi:hypothetical protein